MRDTLKMLAFNQTPEGYVEALAVPRVPHPTRPPAIMAPFRRMSSPLG